MTLRVLVVARGYPSHDAPGRGSSVADHVSLLRAAGADVTVASFETVQIRGETSTRAARLADVESAWAHAVAGTAATNAPAHWGPSGLPVARLPVVRTWGAVDGSEADEHAARHAGVLGAFGRPLARRAAAEGGPLTLIHAHTGLPDGLAAVPLAAELGLPLVVTEHDSTIPRRLEDPHAAAAYRRLLSSATVVAVSQALADRIRSALDGGGGEPPSVGVLPNVVPMHLFPAWTDEPRDDDELLWVGARAPHKGIETLLGAVAAARERRPALHLRMIGPSTRDDEARWIAMARDLGIVDAVRFEPAATRETVGAAMRRTGLFVHPSPWETFGMVAAEALASGAPVVATPSGGVEGIVGRDGRLGEIAADHGPGPLADAIVRLRDRLPAMDRSRFRDDIEARFGAEVTTTRTLDLYRGAGAVIDGPAAAAPSPAASSAPDAHPDTVRSALVVAVHPSSAERVAALPDGTVAVRVVGPPAAPAAPARGGIQRVAVGLRRRLGPAGPTPAAQRHATTLAAIRGAWDDLGTSGSGTGQAIVAADADDVSAVIEALGDPGRDHLAPGSLRWLADRQDAPAGAVGG